MPPDDCLFCGITSGRIPSHRVAESENLVAFLDIAPVRPGHVQIVPRAHHAYFDDLPPELAAEIIQLGQRMAKALKAIYGVGRVAFMFTGNDFAHAHAHLIPMVRSDDVTSRRYIAEEVVTYRNPPRPPVTEQEETAARIRQELAKDQASA
ncbi:HIT family protein [Bosea sp. SSUT16]|jgi:histidine triad (HIT) family protein|uniref:HIT family protein n=1 Tax=Bosea spartocytisi TaxID=2773451 RepID=A0A927E626_9HYPH|nr:HIT family protein [Bosea spartocytisi]MBD3844847.1 HIT family protein [Bosea spartocytisi]MCT4471049.1 HIT family protein [Bosea spartocytisi]